MPLPSDYVERVYAGVLGKIIGVYLGRPFEGWWYDSIMSELGEIYYYVVEFSDLDAFLRSRRGYEADATTNRLLTSAATIAINCPG
jgi:hypothetical protein